ncbi:3-oxo-5-alpha-steroid 4-dehydrogenase [Toxoplasma gondii GT1]|uniref:3-oxo-5-alpha-steroid 4-dehydrogenase n=5 Tax=Toxoplasma gondii TaxID=5811 RepID=S7WC50_TOXGG|nr:3-oxo-5-alpha-steroid 4-dehydrogenase [Toxoplasma gondii GT1]KAF4642141.1 3-oxo-5-alpha-steroid 4-dehydrogenase [Toxoplasma gondii]
MNSLPSALAFGVILSLAIPVVSVACLDPLLLSPFFLFCLSWTAVLCFLAAAVLAVLSLVLPYSLGALAAHGKVRLSLSSTGSGTEARVTEKCSQSLAQLPLQRDARTRPENAKDEQRRWGLQRERNDACGDREEARREVGEEEEAEGQAACRDKAPQREPRSEAAGGEESEAEATGASQVAVEDQQERETKASFVRNCADGMLKALAVPVQKSLFLHFYLLGAGLSLAMALLLSLALRRCRLSLAEKNDTPVSALLSNASPDNIPQGPSSNGQRGKSDLGRLVNEAAAGMATDADLLLPLLLFFLHCLRRLLEQLFVVRTHATASQMSLAAYLLGLSFYVGTPLSLLLGSLGSFLSSQPLPSCSANAFPLSLEASPALFAASIQHVGEALVARATSPPGSVGMTFAAFLLVNCMQLHSHMLLARLRPADSAEGRERFLDSSASKTIHPSLRDASGAYSIPRGGCFAFVSCPHYLAEILIYLCLCLLLPSPPTIACLSFVVATMTVNASKTHTWYRRTFGDAYPQNRRALLPLVY